MEDSSFLSYSNSQIQNSLNSQSNISEQQKNIDTNSSDTDKLFLTFFDNESIKDLNESITNIECDESCKLNKLKLFYLFNNCIVQYKCNNNHKGMAKFNDFYEKIIFLNFFNDNLNILNETFSLENFITDKNLKIKFDEFKEIKKNAIKILNNIQIYKNKLDEIYEFELKILENIKKEYTKKFDNFYSLINNQINLSEKQFYYFQNLVNNNNFNKIEFDNLNLFNFKNPDKNLIYDERIKFFRGNHSLTNFFKFCYDSNSILKESIRENDFEPNDFEKKIYEIFSDLKTEEIDNLNNLYTENIKYYKYFVYFKIEKIGFLKFIKENMIFKCNHNSNDDLIEFYNKKYKFYGKWMNYNNNDNNNKFDIFESVKSFVGKWKKINFKGKIIDCFIGHKIEFELNKNKVFNISEYGDFEKETLDNFFKDFEDKIIDFKKNIKEKIEKYLDKKRVKKKTWRNGKYDINYKTKDMKYQFKNNEFSFIHEKNGIVQGESKNNKLNGYFEIHYKNGDIYKGEIKDGKKNGFGIFYKATFQIWEDDKKIY